MEIRRWTDADATATAALAAATWPDDPWMAGRHRQHPRALAAYVAVADGEIIGAASTRREPWHPTKLELVGTVAAAHRRLGVGSALLARVRADLPGERLLPRTPAGDASGLAFLHAHGFRQVLRCRVVRIPPGPAVDAWCARNAAPVVTDGLDPDAVRALCYRVYAHTLADNPPDMAPDDWREAFFDELPPALAVAYAGPEAVGLAWGTVVGGDLDVGSSGVLPGVPADAYRALIAWLLRWAGERGLTADAEVDDSDTALDAMIDELPCELRYDLRHLELGPAAPRTVE